VSARFVAATTERLAGLSRRPLDEQRWLIIFIDGFSFGQHLLVGALGVTAERINGYQGPAGGGRAHTIETATLCTRLTANLRSGSGPSHGLARRLERPPAQLVRPGATVRSWLRRFTACAEQTRARHSGR
jgi:hypothetical protein